MRFDSLNRFTLLLSLQDAGSIGAPAGGGEPAAPASAPAPSEPTPTPTAAPASSPTPVPGADPLAEYNYTSLGDLARQLAEGPPAPTGEPAPTLTATPEGAPPEATAGGEPVPIPGAGQEPQPVVPPTQQFEALKTELETQKTAVTEKEQALVTAQGRIAEFEAYAPAVEIMRSNPGMVEVVNMLAPVLNAGLTGFEDPRAGEVGTKLIEQLDQYDQRIASALINGTLAFYGKDIARKALEGVGIAEADIPDYQRWKASNGAASPAFTLDKFPEPLNSDSGEVDYEAGMALVPIVDAKGNTTYEQLDMSDLKDARTYNYEKQNFERTQADKAKEISARSEKQTQAAEQKAAQERQAATTKQQNVATWQQTRGQAETAIYEALAPEFTGEFEWMHEAASSLAHLSMWKDPEYQRLLKDGRDAAANGEGRAEAIGADVDTRLAKKHIAAAVSHYSEIVRRLAAAEAATQEGKLKLPEDAPRIGAETQLTRPIAAAPQPVPLGQPQPANAPPEIRPGENYVDYVRRVNHGSLGSRMVAQVR